MYFDRFHLSLLPSKKIKSIPTKMFVNLIREPLQYRLPIFVLFRSIFCYASISDRYFATPGPSVHHFREPHIFFIIIKGKHPPPLHTLLILIPPNMDINILYLSIYRGLFIGTNHPHQTPLPTPSPPDTPTYAIPTRHPYLRHFMLST